MKWIHVVCALAAMLWGSIPSGRAVADQAGTAEFSLDYNKSLTEWGGTSGTLGGGIGVGIAYWRAASPDLSWGFEASYDDLGRTESSFIDPFTLQSGSARFDLRVLRFNPAFRVNFGRSRATNFLAQFGAGLYNVNVRYRYENVFIVDDDDSDTKFGFNVGAGAGFPLGRAKSINVMASYHVVAGEEVYADDFNHIQIRASLGVPL